MDIQKIIAGVYFNKGHQGFEESYDSTISLDNYIKHFEDETRRINQTSGVVINFVRTTEHNKDGSFKRDEDGRRIETFLYKRDGYPLS